MKKVLSLALALLMLMSLLAMPVYADGYGTASNPEPVPKPSALAEELELAPGQTYYYQFPALKFTDWTLSAMNVTAIEMDGVMHTELSLIDRCIKVTLTMEGNLIGLVNDTEEAVLVTLTLEQPVGTVSDPFIMEDGDNAISIPASYPQYYAMYLPMSNGNYTLGVSDYENFMVYIDTDYDPTTDADWVQLKKATVFECESYMPLYFVVCPIGPVPDITLSVTPPKKGTADNPYMLFGYYDIALGASGEEDALWPATSAGVHYSLWGLDNTTLVVETTSAVTLNIHGVSYTVNGRKEIALAPNEDGYYNVIATSASNTNMKLDVVFPVGTDMNPLSLKLGNNTLPLDEYGNTYYASYTAPRDGVLIITPNTVNGLGYTDAVNQTTFDYDYIFAGYEGEGASDDNVLTIPVSAGDNVLITSCAGENEDFEIFAMNLILNIAYEPAKLEIVTQPKTSYAPMGGKVSVSVSAKGDGLIYEWWIKNEGQADYSKSSITDSTYTTAINATSKNRLVKGRVIDAYGNSVWTETVMLRESASITTAPKNAYGALGEKVVVSLKASGDGLTYAWHYKDAGMADYAKSSNNTATYDTIMNAERSGRMLKCKVTDKYGNSVWSDAVRLCEKVSIVTAPVHGYAPMGEKVSVSVKASGDGLTYAWYYKDGGMADYAKASSTSATYTVVMSAARKGRMLKCKITDKYGNYVWTTAVLLRESVSIVTEPTTGYAAMGEKVSVSVKASGDGLTYVWRVKNAGSTKYSSSSITSNTYTVTMSDKVKDRLVFCYVYDKYGNEVKSVTVRLREAVSIKTEPKNTTAAKGEKISVSVKASGDGLTYTWYVKNEGASKYTKSSITKSTYSVTMSDKVHNRLVYCVVTDKYGNVVKTVKVRLKMK